MKYQVEFKQIRGGAEPASARWEVACEPVETRGMALAYAELTAMRLGTPAVVRTVKEDHENWHPRFNAVIAYFGTKEHAVEVLWFEFEFEGREYRTNATNDVTEFRTHPGANWRKLQYDPARKPEFYRAHTKVLYGA
jgi:hypothetical protein